MLRNATANRVAVLRTTNYELRIMQKSLKPSSDRTSDILQAEKSNPLDAIFAPQSVAIIGASEKVGSVGRTILWNLISNPFGGTVFPSILNVIVFWELKPTLQLRRFPKP